MTYPLLLAIERDAAHGARLVAEVITNMATDDEGDDDASAARDAEIAARHRAIAERIVASGALADARRTASERIAQAIASLAPIADGPARQALVTVALATDSRER